MSRRTRSTARKASPPLERPVVLLVDDDPDWRLLVRDILAHCELAGPGPDVHEVGDGEAALQYLFSCDTSAGQLLPALIYLDCEMPRLDGLTMLKVIRRDPRLQHIPVVMLTGVGDEAEIRRAADAGASAYIVKPSAAEDLRRVINASASFWLVRHGHRKREIGQAA